MPAPGTKTESGRRVNSAKGNSAEAGPSAAAGTEKTGKSRNPSVVQLKHMPREEQPRLLATLQKQVEEASADGNESDFDSKDDDESEEENSE